jgi:alginate O-acetyltransferase complex protein AlgI
MQFASLNFLAFFVIVLTFTWTFGRKRHIRNAILLLASYLFYAQISLQALSLLIVSSMCNYVFGNAIAAATMRVRRWCLFIGIGFNLGFLGLFKYLNFFRSSTEDIAYIFGIEAHLPLLEVILPIGISFYTFQALTYLIDIYKGHGVRAKGVLDFALYQAFFPQLLIGPICRSIDLLPQIHAEPPKKLSNTTEAGVLIISGLFKKIIIATMLFDHGVTDSFQEPENFSTIGLWGGMIGYSIQLYCDFSGYTDLARGFALLLGFRIPDNFNSPYTATNVGDFWKRWHITFSQWLRDYIYIPLGGSRKSSWRISLNLFITFLFCGFWHGASWGYVIWGGAHGIALAIHKRNRDRLRAKGINPEAYRGIFHFWVGWLYTFGFVALSRIIFVSPTLDSAFVYYTRLFNPSSIGLGAKITLVYAIVLGLIINFYGDNFFKTIVHSLEKKSPILQFVTITCLLVSLLLLRPGGVPPYLYFQF